MISTQVFPPLQKLPGRRREEEREMDLVDVRGVLRGVAGGGPGPAGAGPGAAEGRGHHGLQLARDDLLLPGLRLRRRTQLRHLPHQLRRDSLLPGMGLLKLARQKTWAKESLILMCYNLRN